MYFHLIYISRETETLNEDGLRKLLSQSRSKNEKLEITGMLVYLNGQFLQLLEGDREAVMELFHVIEQDSRHEKVRVVLEGSLENRLFDQWSMGWKKLEMEELQTLAGFSDLDEFFREGAITNENHPALIFLKLFYSKNSKQPDFSY